MFAMKSAGRTGSRPALLRGVMLGTAIVGLMSFAAPAFAAPLPQQAIFDELTQLENATGAAVLGVVDRPDAPFVSGLAADTPAGACTPAVWTRGSTDQTKTKGSSEVDVNLSNIEFGADMSCFDVGKSGLDITGGLIGGKGIGAGTATAIPGASVAVDQTFYGGYVTFSSNGLTGDVQVRDDKFNFTASGLSAFDVTDGTQVGADRMAVSGSLAYAFKLGSDMQLIPAVGFDISRTTTGTLAFTTGTGSLDVIQGKIGYIGATLAKTVLLPDGSSAVIPFLTATYYDDFSPQITGTFTDTSNNTTTLAPANGTGSFTELSAGLNYVKVLDKNSGGLKQVTAAIRGDLRFNDQFTGEALTAQLRLQF
jgi:fibronectin-binding autotransporter adhesin